MSLRFDVVTLFPELFAPVLSQGVIRRAFVSAEPLSAEPLSAEPLSAEPVSAKPPSAPIDLRFHNPRDWSDGTYRRVDDRPFGGGPGMVMLAEPLARCVEAVLAQRATGTPVALFSPIGSTFNQQAAQSWAASSGAVLICGRYEGIDQRFIDRFVTQQISLGDFVLSGGEIPAMAMLDAVARLMPGVLNDEASHAQDSFGDAIGGLLDCPHYTRPTVWRGEGVPPVLMSGNHAHIDAWRREQRSSLTLANRPDLFATKTEATK